MARSIHPYAPFVPPGARSLLLGSVPPPRFCARTALRPHDVDFFYGSADNAFWSLVGEACGSDFRRAPDTRAIAQRQEFLSERHIAVADIVASCLRRNNGASDSDLQDLEFFTLAHFLDQLPAVTSLLFTSLFVQRHSLRLLGCRGNAGRTGSLQWNGRHLNLITLYSPSPLALRGLGPHGAERRREQYRSVFG